MRVVLLLVLLYRECKVVVVCMYLIHREYLHSCMCECKIQCVGSQDKEGGGRGDKECSRRRRAGHYIWVIPLVSLQ